MRLMIRTFLFTVLLAFGFIESKAQDSAMLPLPTYKVAVFSPMYLDSVFSGTTYRLGKNVPKFALPGLEFAEGARIAFDSMAVLNGNIQASIFDSKSSGMPVSRLLASGQLNDYKLIIGNVRDAEYTQLAQFAKDHRIPFISAVLPNDGGVTDNPYLAINNPTLRGHCEAIYSYLLTTNSASNILLVRRAGAQEDKVEEYFRSMNNPDGTNLLKIKTIRIDNDLTKINYELDSTKNNVVIGGSLNTQFASALAEQCSRLNTNYPIMLIGMPNWDAMPIFRSKDKLQDFPVYFTTPYYNNEYDGTSKRIQTAYKRKMKVAPTDLVYKGFELAYVYARLLSLYPNNFMEHMNDYSYKIFTDFNFKPVYLDKVLDGTPDYYENKRLYLMKVLNGITSKVW